MDLTKLTNEVSRITTVVPSVVALINRMATEIQDHKDDPAAIDALAEQLRAAADDIGTAVTANTPSEPPPAPPAEPSSRR